MKKVTSFFTKLTNVISNSRKYDYMFFVHIDGNKNKRDEKPTPNILFYCRRLMMRLELLHENASYHSIPRNKTIGESYGLDVCIYCT